MVNNVIGKSLVVLVAIAFLFSTSCANYSVIKTQETSLRDNLKEGDIVRIVTKDGSHLRLRILDITDKAIIGADQRPYDRNKKTIPIIEISKLEKIQTSAGKTAGLVAGIVVGVIAITLIYLAINLKP